jgi:hypothetical protein
MLDVLFSNFAIDLAEIFRSRQDGFAEDAQPTKSI